MRYGADRFCLPVPDDQALAPRCFETHDNADIYLRRMVDCFILPFVSPQIRYSFSSRVFSIDFVLSS